MRRAQTTRKAKTLVVRLRDGKIIADERAVLHSEIISWWNLNCENVVDTGFRIGSKYYWRSRKAD